MRYLIQVNRKQSPCCFLYGMNIPLSFDITKKEIHDHATSYDPIIREDLEKMMGTADSCCRVV
jgi:hypothetical protein